MAEDFVPSEHEIRKALFRMKPLKAPGSDGFHPIFFQRSWQIVWKDLCREVQGWFRKKCVPESLCRALICLIPKKPSPENVKQFRPISLCNTLYKLVTKVMVNRLKSYISEWIFRNQNSFIKGRGPKVNLSFTPEGSIRETLCPLTSLIFVLIPKVLRSYLIHITSHTARAINLYSTFSSTAPSYHRLSLELS